MFKISHFKISLFRACPFQYKCQYLDHLPTKPKPYLTMGAHVHNALKDFYEKVTPEKRDAKTLEYLLKVRWLEDRKVFPTREEENKWGTKALSMLRLYCARHDIQKTPVMLEDYYSLPLGNDFEVIGRIDRVDEQADGSLHVIDYKTGMRREEDIDDLQLLLYAAIIGGNVKKTITKASFLYLQSMSWYDCSINEDDIQAAGEEILRLAEDIKNEKEFLPKINKYCHSCDFLEICPKKNEIEQQASNQD